MQKNFKPISSILPFLLMILASAAFVYVAKDRTSTLDFQQVWQSLINNWPLAFLAVCLLMPNWLIETIKWKSLVQKFIAIDFLNSVKSILAGIGLSIFTPNRIGDFGGRVLYVKKEERLTTFYMTFLCASSQLLTTIFIGSAGLIYFLPEIVKIDALKIPKIFVAILIFGNMLLLMLYLNLEKFRNIYRWLFPKIRSKIEEFPSVAKKQKWQILIWSFLRYQIFVVQFYLLMLVFGSETGFVSSYFALSLVYLFTSFMPTSVISEIPVRGSIVFFVFSFLDLEAELAVISFVLMWLINLFIPAIFSLYLLKDVKLPSLKKTNIA